MGGHLQSARDWIVWQLADSSFPSGGFAHSGGLEPAFQQGEVRGRIGLANFIEAALHQCAHSAIPFVANAFDRSITFGDVDCLCDSFTSNHIANRASRSLGKAFLATSTRAFHSAELSTLHEQVLREKLPGHFAPVFGEVTHALGVERLPALRLFLFNQLRGWISSAVRLGIVGPIEAQSLQASLAARAEECLALSANLTLDDAVQTAPLIDLFQGTQDRLYSRLFQS